MNVLGIDTSNQPMSVAVYKDHLLAAEMTVNIKRNHSIQLMPAIKKVMEQADLNQKQLNHIVVAEGPGSFTGIRIGMTTAKTLAWTLNIPIKTISSLKLLAGNLIYNNGYVCPFFDARRGNVYTGLYRVKHGQIETVEKDCNIDMQIWLEKLKNLNETVFFVSPNGEDFDNQIKNTLSNNAIIVKQSLNIPRAGLAIALSKKEKFIELHTVKPNYQRMTQAEANWLEKNGKGLKNE